MAAPGSVVGPGIIPAHAGFTGRPGRARRSSRDHPRTRGVYPWAAAMASRRVGSSPHTRGLRLVRKGVLVRVGIIPAHAGFTVMASSSWWPRDGSSPHTRGLPGPPALGCRSTGIIPAHAGFTPRRRQERGWHQDHPRTRGVYRDAVPSASTSDGSSPHTRGLRCWVMVRLLSLGIIPAHAGFTSRRTRSWRPPRDHPRTRGVYIIEVTRRLPVPGSSPHTRGLPAGPGGRRGQDRIIPAHAGFTPGRSGPGPGPPDHPRTRGVYASRLEANVAPAGSSPHTRGLLGGGRGHGGLGRIIPAHAGFTPGGRGGRGGAGDHPRTRGVYAMGRARR